MSGAGGKTGLRRGPDRRLGPAGKRASGPGLRFGPGRIGLVGFREKGSGPRVWAAGLGSWVLGLGFFSYFFPLFYFKHHSNLFEFKRIQTPMKSSKIKYAPA